MSNGNHSSSDPFNDFLNGNSGAAQGSKGISTRTFLLNLATGVALFTFELTGFFLLKSSNIGRRIYQPKTYLVPERLRVEAIPKNVFRWLKRIFSIDGEELKLKCGLDGYFAIRFLRALAFIFLPLMAILVVVLLPINYHGGKDQKVFEVGGHPQRFNVTGLDTLSWQNVAPDQTSRYWAHLVCALLAISWALYRIYREKLHFIQTRQEYLTSPEHRLKASAKTILVTNIPNEYRGSEALKALFDVFVDNDDRNKLHVWVNRDFSSLRKLVSERKSLCHALEKEELRILRAVNKKYRSVNDRDDDGAKRSPEPTSSSSAGTSEDTGDQADAQQHITDAFETDCHEKDQRWHKFLDDSKEGHVTLMRGASGSLKPVSALKFWQSGHKSVPKVAWLRSEIARLTIQIEEMLTDLSNDTRFKRQNSAFVQFDRQMAANMACALVTHHHIGCMSPRFLHVAPHEILWPNMGLTSLARFVRSCCALVLFVGILVLWGIPATFLGILSQLEAFRYSYTWLSWLRHWPDWVVSLIAGPLSAILLALLIQLVVPALCRKLAVLVGAPTRSKRELVTQGFYFTFLFVELVLVTSISSSIFATISGLLHNPTTVANTLATDLPKAANYFFNYLIIQALGFSGSVLFQYLRLLFITLIWPWFTQTPREEAWLQTTIPHQMWANVMCMWTNFAVIGLIYSVVAPLMLIFSSVVFMLFWIAYRHNYYYVQKNKVDTHGLLFNNALSQLFAGVYVLEITLIGLFFLVRDTQYNVACSAQAIIMIVALILTAAFHFVLESYLHPLSELLPVTLEDKAADAERKRFGTTLEGAEDDDADPDNEDSIELDRPSSGAEKAQQPASDSQVPALVPKKSKATRGVAGTAEEARKIMRRLGQKIDANHSRYHAHLSQHAGTSHKIEVADQLGEAIAEYPDELIDLSRQERDAVLRAAYQDPVTREPQPVIWIPADEAGVSEDSIKRAKKYGPYLQYSNAGAFLTRKNKCEVTQPAPDVRSDWLLDWVL